MPLQKNEIATALIGTLGYAVLVLWADLLGHAPGFSASSSGIQPMGNARIFFLFGFTIAALVSFFIRTIKQSQSFIWLISTSLAGTIGTFLFWIPGAMEIPAANALIILGLFLCGASYYTMAIALFVSLASIQRIAIPITSIALALMLKTALTGITVAFTSPASQAVVATCLPIIVILCQAALQGNFWKLASGDERTHDAPTGKTPVRFLVVASVVVAALRGFSHLGLWGEGYIGPSVDHVGDYLFVAIALALFAYFVLIRNCDSVTLRHYQAALLVPISGFFIYVIANQEGAQQTAMLLLSDYYVATELFGHLLLRAILFSCIRTNTMAGWRIQGLADTAYGVTSIIWTVLLQDAVISVIALVTVSMFFALLATLQSVNDKASDTETDTSPNYLPADNETSLAASSAPKPVDLSEQISLFYDNLAAEHALSPRETEVFLLLARGYSRARISEELYISDGTVKTHVAHIYRKFGASSRQELLLLIQDKQQASSPKA